MSTAEKIWGQNTGRPKLGGHVPVSTRGSTTMSSVVT